MRRHEYLKPRGGKRWHVLRPRANSGWRRETLCGYSLSTFWYDSNYDSNNDVITSNPCFLKQRLCKTCQAILARKHEYLKTYAGKKWHVLEKSKYSGWHKTVCGYYVEKNPYYHWPYSRKGNEVTTEPCLLHLCKRCHLS